MQELKIDNEKQFVRELLRLYLNDKFGSFNKSEIEELLLYLLMEYGNLGEMSNFEKSIILHIPETKVRSSIYKAQLRFCEYDDKLIINEFFDLLSSSKYEISTVKQGKDTIETICITIENQYLKGALEAKIKEIGKVIKGDFYKETLLISKEAFSILIENLFTPEQRNIIKIKYEKLKGKGKIDFSFSSIVLTYLTNMGLNLGVKSLATLVSSALKDGAIDNFVNNLLICN